MTIGINDKGVPVGVTNASQLLEELSNKIHFKLGIVPDVALLRLAGKECVRIAVDAQSELVSFNGRFYYRSGSTVQELNGSTLQSMILDRRKMTWDSVLVSGVTLSDFSDRAFDLYRRKAVKSGRESQSFLMESKEAILRNLKLMQNGMLTRAAVILFHPNPEQYILGSSIRIGYFLNDADLLHQDTLDGSLLEQLDMIEGGVENQVLEGVHLLSWFPAHR